MGRIVEGLFVATIGGALAMWLYYSIHDSHPTSTSPPQTQSSRQTSSESNPQVVPDTATSANDGFDRVRPP